MALSDLLISYLKLLGVEYVFGVPGGAIAPLYDALARSEKIGDGGPRAIVARQESGAVFMADGYARETGKIGVCCATTGPGATNMITGIASAHADHIPVLAITAQTALPNFGRGAFQESSADSIDTVAIFNHCTCHSTIISHPHQFETKLAAALTKALQPPKGPVHLSVPLDVFRYPANRQIAFPNLNSLLTESSEFDSVAVDELCQELNQALSNHRKVVIVIGYDCENSIREIVKFAELIEAQIVMTPGGKSCAVDSYHPLVKGVIGFAGHDSAFKTLTDNSVELILAVGSRLDEWSTGSWDPAVLMNDKLVHIQNSRLYFGRSPMARLHVYGNTQIIFKQLIAQIQAANIGKTLLNHNNSNKQEYKSEKWLGKEKRGIKPMLRCLPRQIEVNTPIPYRREINVLPPIKPQRLMCELVQRFPPDTRFLADTGNSFAWALHYLFPNKGGICRLSMGLAAMGWAIGASVGTFLGQKSKGPVVCITGDGSYLMNGQEITVAVAHKLNVIFVVLNDHALGMVKHGQKLTEAEAIGHRIPPINLCEMATAMGADGYIIQDIGDFEQIDFEAISTTQHGPTLLDVRVDEDEIPPMGMRVTALRAAKTYAFTELKQRAEDLRRNEETRRAQIEFTARTRSHSQSDLG